MCRVWNEKSAILGDADSSMCVCQSVVRPGMVNVPTAALVATIVNQILIKHYRLLR